MLYRWIRKWVAIISRLPLENQVLRSDVARLTKSCDLLQQQRNHWQELHRAAGTGYMTSQEIMVREIIRLAEKAGEQPNPGLSKVVELYAEAHVKPHLPVVEPASEAAAAASPAPSIATS